MAAKNLQSTLELDETDPSPADATSGNASQAGHPSPGGPRQDTPSTARPSSRPVFAADVLRQLEAITQSSLFSKSKRYPNFLRYIVEQTLAGQTDLHKERTLGMQVFGRVSDYDTNADPVVRVTAGEIRKRLAQFYQLPGHEAQLRVDLPLGSYTPVFSRPVHETPIHDVPDPAPRQPIQLETRLGPASGEGVGGAEGAAPSREVHTQTAAVPEQQAVGSARLTPFPESSLHLPRIRETVFRRMWMALLGMGLLAVACYALVLAFVHLQERGIETFWTPLLHAEAPALIVLGVHSFGPDGKDTAGQNTVPVADADAKQSMLAAMTSTNMVPLSDVASYSQITDLLVRHTHPYRTQSSAETTFGQLQPGPVILIGGLDNAWTLRLTAPLRFRFGCLACADGLIEDTMHPGIAWRFNNAQNARSNSRDYALVASFFDPAIEQRVLIAAGIGRSGTAAAANILTNNKYLQSSLAERPMPKGGNIELVLSTEIVEGQQGPPRVVAGYTW